MPARPFGCSTFPSLDLGTPESRGFLAFLAMAERERTHRQAHTRGPSAGIARGVRMGRKPKLTKHQRQQALKRLAAGDETTREIARDYAVHHSTIARLR
jgi:DNA invertase Pin-like site-specific DNA recombinase